MSSDSESDPADNTEEPSQNSSHPSAAWIEAMQDMFDTAVDRQAEIECEIDDMEIEVPLQLGPDPEYAEWSVNGTLQFRFDGIGDPLAEWFRLQETRQSSDDPSDSTED